MEIEVLSQLFNSVLGDYWGAVILTFVCTLCAIIAAFTPAPTEQSGFFYKLIYKVINTFAVNVGKAKNADEVVPQK